jgi:NAD(P)-dependent dehydrogenase (short-subunit alcohol dehydrogenase family)
MHARSGNPERPQLVARTAPLRRIAKPEDIAEAIMWLASDHAAFASGAILSISGGL